MASVVQDETRSIFMNTSEVAAFLRLDRGTVVKYARRGLLRAIRLPGDKDQHRQFRFYTADVLKLAGFSDEESEAQLAHLRRARIDRLVAALEDELFGEEADR